VHWRGEKQSVALTGPALRFIEPSRSLRPARQLNAAVRLRKHKTYTRGQTVHNYLLSRMVFCAKCGHAMSGQCNFGIRYYRHARDRNEGCTGRLSCPPADRLEEIVLFQLFDLFGNASRVAQAIRDASPDLEQQAIDRSLAREKLASLTADEQRLSEQLDKLAATLANVPSAAQIKIFAEKVTRRSYVEPRHKIVARLANSDIHGMTFEERRELVQMVFAGKTPDGRRLGVYVTLDGKKPQYRILGRLVDESGTVPTKSLGHASPEDWWQEAPRQQDLLDTVTNSADP
jgi:hypothetical protein